MEAKKVELLKAEFGEDMDPEDTHLFAAFGPAFTLVNELAEYFNETPTAVFNRALGTLASIRDSQVRGDKIYTVKKGYKIALCSEDTETEDE